MSAGTRFPLAEADDVAAEIVELLEPYCERLEVAGSIRRRCPEVGDVEIVAIPRYGGAPRDLFGMAVDDPVDFLHEACEGLLAAVPPRPRLSFRYSVGGRAAWGRRLKWCYYNRSGSAEQPSVEGYPLDIYSTTPEQWGVTLAIRTGPAAFSRRLVTLRSQGGLCPGHLRFKDWRVVRRDTDEALDTPEERDVFWELGLDWLEPGGRRLMAGALWGSRW